MSMRLLRVLFFCAIAALVATATESVDGAIRYSRPSPTTAATSFRSYVVTVNSMQLVSSTGAKVQLLSSPLAIDFAQAIDLEDAVYSGLVPAGDYVAANLVVDYSTAQITVDDGSGNVVALHPFDSNSTPLKGTAAVNLKLDRYRHFVVSPRTAALTSFNVDLAQTTRTDLANRLVYVSSTLYADVVSSGSRWMQLSGSLASASENSVVITVPASRTINSVSGPITVELNPTTTYTIQGSPYTGTDGQAILVALAKGTRVYVTGALHSDRKTLAAVSVAAGSF